MRRAVGNREGRNAPEITVFHPPRQFSPPRKLSLPQDLIHRQPRVNQSHPQRWRGVPLYAWDRFDRREWLLKGPRDLPGPARISLRPFLM